MNCAADNSPPPLRLVNLGSGSRGNASVVFAGEDSVLVDCGLSCKQILLRMESAGLDPSTLRAVLITHEHSDHVSGLRVTARRLGIPAYMTPACAGAVSLRGEVEVRAFTPGESFPVGPFVVEPFRVPHDTVDPVGFVVGVGEDRVGIATDLGSVNRLVISRLQTCRVVLLEFNHDVEMLLSGPYPWHLKQRVRSRHGHLSNAQAAEILQSLVGSRVEQVLLAHLSEKNNRVELALAAAHDALEAGKALHGSGSKPIRLLVAEQAQPTTVDN